MEALTSLYGELAEPLARYAMCYIKEIHLAEDIVSETFLRAARHCIVNSEIPAKAWFYKVTRNIALDMIRKNAKIEYVEIEETIDASIDTNPERQAEYNEQVETLEASLSKVPEPYKSVLSLKEFDGLTYAQISHKTGLSLDNVKVVLFRGRQMLRNIYRKDYKYEL